MMLMSLYFGSVGDLQVGSGAPEFHLGNLDASPAVIAAFLIGTVLLAALMLWLESRPDLKIDPDDPRAASTKVADSRPDGT